MECSIYRDQDHRWDEFVTSHPAATFFHLAAWRQIIEKSFRYEAIYLCAKEADKICGVLPLFLVKSLLFGRSLVAIPVGVYGGPLATDKVSLQMLTREATELAKRHRVRYLEIRGNPYNGSAFVPNENGSSVSSWSRKDLYVTFMSEIATTDEGNFARIPRKQRRMVRQGDKHQLRAFFDNGRLRDFYNVYAESVRNLGTPVYGYSYFENLIASFGDRCKILLVDLRGKIIAAVVSFFFRDQVLPYYGGALKEYFHLAPNDFMYWELMRYATSAGYKIFDFGRSKEGTGSYNFKRHWGFEATALPYWYYSLNGHGVPDTSPLNPKLQWAIRIWRGLPLKITNTVGPRIIRHIP